jgi:hypothetical protein
MLKEASNKANSTVSFLKRNLNIANKSVKERAYQSQVRPSLEYSSAVWDPHQQHLQQSKLYHRLPQEKSEYCQQISQRKGLSVTSETILRIF